MITNVIRAELFKAVRKRRSYVLAGLQWLLFPAVVLIIARVLQVNVTGSFLDEEGGITAALQAFASPYGLTQLSLALPTVLAPPYLIIVIALVAALLIGEERSQNMWKTVLVAQPSRVTVLTGKLITAFILIGIFLAGSILASLLFGALGTLFLPTTFAGDWPNVLRLYAVQWLFSLAALTFAFLMVWWIRNAVLGIVAVFFLPSLLESLYSIYAATVGFQPVNRFNAFLQGARLLDTFRNLPRYFFTNNLYAPSRDPLAQIGQFIGTGPNDPSGAFANLVGFNINLTQAGVVMLVYTALFALILFVSFVRRDIS